MGIYLNDTFELKLYNNLNNKLLAIEHYTDSSLQVENGLFLSYHDNASPVSQGSFVKGKADGLWKRWDTLGHTIDSTLFNNGEKIMEVRTGYYKNGALDSFIINDVENDRLKKLTIMIKGN